MSDNLISRIKEKPLKYFMQGAIALSFFNISLESGIRCAEKINKYEPQIRRTIDGIGYWALQVGTPLLTVGAMACLGYVAVKGTGMFMEKELYQPQTKPKSNE